jgi:hypothetical protein
MLNSRRVELLDLPRLKAQFVSLERRTSRAGKDSIDAAQGRPEDVANAVAGAASLVGTAKEPLRFSSAFMRRAAQPSIYGHSELSVALRQLRENNR